MKTKLQRKEVSVKRQVALLKRGVSYHQVGDLQNASLIYRQILRESPQNPDALNLLGVVSTQQGKYDVSVALITKAISIKPTSSPYHNNLGNVYRIKRQLDDAIRAYQQALKLDQNSACAHNGLGVVLYEQNRLPAAILRYRRALEINPRYVEAYDNMGQAFHKLGAFEEAIKNFRRAREIDPHFSQSYSNLALSLGEIGEVEESIESFEQALERNPNDKYTVINLFRQLQATCSWHKIEELEPKLDLMVKSNLERGEKTVETPFMSISRKIDPEENIKIASSRCSEISKQISQNFPPFDFSSRSQNRKKVRLGYLSNNFNNHPVAHQMQSVFALHECESFEVFAYSYGKDDGSQYRKKISEEVDHFIDISDCDDRKAAEKIYHDNIDILVDLVVFTEGGRLEISAMRPAPLQVNYLGFAGSSGGGFFDYIIADKILIPHDLRHCYSEEVVYMPQSYMVSDHTQSISGKPFMRTDFGLPENAMVFCSLNNAYKIEPVLFDAWMRILHRVPDSVLWLSRSNSLAEKNLREEAIQKGIDPDRLVFADKVETKDDHLARLRLADLMLDTRIYNGHATGCDALWAGVPVVTIEGGHFASRVGSSMLHAVGLPELVTKDISEYENLVIGFASSPTKRDAIRRKLARNRTTSPLFDTRSFVRALETAYKRMLFLYYEERKREDIELSSSATIK
ncbi:MAG: tetratricopeptide repeat protein [Planctomycetes bacterium]|nr:tetratricopeptide repeat protein [Planctomycetota bacterium]